VQRQNECMIIELLGSPGAGKTTFARALAVRLEEGGHAVELLLSHRPAERQNAGSAGATQPMHGPATAVASRVIRPVTELFSMVFHPSASSLDVRAALELVMALRPKSWVWLIRQGQYILRLSRARRVASRTNTIVVFDQGFIQAVSSLALLGRAPNETQVARALDLAPKPDLLIRLDAPYELLEARLRERENRQSVIERLFELDLGRSLESGSIIDHMCAMLRMRGQSVVDAFSIDRQSLHDSVEQIARRIDQKSHAPAGSRDHPDRPGGCDGPEWQMRQMDGIDQV
jgi:hypothetical protein